MNTVEPIRNMEMVLDIADYLKVKNERNYVMFMFGIHSGLRISDILKLRVRDVKDKKYLYIREAKTGKEKKFIIQKELKNIIDNYIENKKEYEYMFKSNKGINKPITRQYAYILLKDAANKFGLESIGTHTLRKTFGYFLYQQTKDIVAVKEILNHSDVSITRRYIGLTQDNKDKMVSELTFRRK